VLDTGDILKTAIDQRLGLTITDEAKAAYGVFRRIWQQPTDEQRRAVSERALRIATASKTRRRNFSGQACTKKRIPESISCVASGQVKAQPVK
jgi:hypothetical protein